MDWKIDARGVVLCARWPGEKKARIFFDLNNSRIGLETPIDAIGTRPAFCNRPLVKSAAVFLSCT